MSRQLAKVICDSLSPDGVRLTTLELQMPRIVLAEFNTHRAKCLAGDVELEFDLPTAKRGRRVHKMRLDEFVDKWLHGARRYAANPKRNYDLTWVKPDEIYTSMEAAARMGMASQLNINTACRSGALPRAEKAADGRTWLFTGQALLEWRGTAPEHTRFDIRARLGSMRIRQLNEETGDIQTSHVMDAVVSGTKEVFEVIAGDYSVAGSKDHRVLTVDGWKTIGDLAHGDQLVVRKFGTRDDEKRDPMRLRKIGGVWRCQWQREQRARMIAEDPTCRRCREQPVTQVHHVDPVYQNPARAFDESNITALCDMCHDDMHAEQDWQVTMYLYGAVVTVEAVVFRGIEPTYDLTIAGAFPNFLANGVVVHNSRNSASSRAIPIEKMIARVSDEPYIPEEWGQNGKGMQAHGELSPERSEEALNVWLWASRRAVKSAEYLARLGVHKQTTNRLLEPFLWHTVIVTATEWSNFFHLRCHEAAHPAIRKTAEAAQAVMAESTPTSLDFDEWHLPYVDERDDALSIADKVKVSTARCARVSYLTHDGQRDPAEDVALHDRLLAPGHMSPTEHPARPLTRDDVAARLQAFSGVAVDPYALRPEQHFVGNFRGWLQYRKTIPGEADILGYRKEGQP